MANEMIKNRITDVMQEPSAPEELVRRTIVRAQALSAGRNAEEKHRARKRGAEREE